MSTMIIIFNSIDFFCDTMILRLPSYSKLPNGMAACFFTLFFFFFSKFYCPFHCNNFLEQL